MLFKNSFNALLGVFGVLGLLASTCWRRGPILDAKHSAPRRVILCSLFYVPVLRRVYTKGIAAFNSDPATYQVFRNVMSFGAVGDGSTDDTAAINNAISSGDRCGLGCNSTTTAPAIIYFPPGVYKVSTPLIAIYQTQFIGDARNPPTLLADPSFNGIAVIDADPYIANGQYYDNTDNFFRSVRNFIIDLRQVPGSATGIHWQVSQGTSLINIVFQMSTAGGTQHVGIFMENGSGGFLGDLVFNGGNIGATFGNQQFTVRNLTFNNPVTAVRSPLRRSRKPHANVLEDKRDLELGVGFAIAQGDISHTGNQGVGAEAIIDAVVTNTSVFVQNAGPTNGVLQGSLVLNNVQLTNVPVAVGVANGATVLAGGTISIDTWVQGNVWAGTGTSGTFTQDYVASISKPASVLDSAGRIFGKSHPQYVDYAPSDFVSVRSQGAAGDGQTDDTAAIQSVFDQFAGCKIIFFDAGTYIVTDTIAIPAGTQVVGEAWSVIMGSGNAFFDYNNPRAVVQVGESGSTGLIEITDMIFTTQGPAAGAIIVEWNVHEPEGQQGGAGTWDTHLIIGGIAGSDLQAANCPTDGSGGNSCFSDFLGIHLTTGSTAYLEGMWVWLADHDLDTPGNDQISLWSGRGLFSESQGPVWLIGTASEHHIIYEYYLRGAANHYIGLAQTETPYFQPNPVPPAPLIPNPTYDPTDVGTVNGDAWAFTVENSQDILVFGAGFYSAFQVCAHVPPSSEPVTDYLALQDYSTTCQDTQTCQEQIVNVDSASSIAFYSLTTIHTTYQLSVDGQGVIPEADNSDAFASTVSVWTSS
ncbi:hypothetical protein NM688_g3306 [Phlebia brevispora]|uniref:Uncharacterized protein n=1 Tax=Phlebia brevispora TaxID=194682 RepID=A0ACC1T653_9APHY|nr:hypothetical protein NM688_g3306 [Phlebia brevispora]